MTVSDLPEGMLYACELDGMGGKLPIHHRDALVHEPPKSQWLHLDAGVAEAQTWLRAESGLSDIAVDGLLATETRPRIASRGRNLLVIARGINLNPGSDPDDMVSVRIWSDGKRLISTQMRTLLSTADLQRALQEGHGPVDIPKLLLFWLGRIVDRMEGTLESLEDSLAALEERTLAGVALSGLRVDFARLRRQCISLRRYLAPQREALMRLASDPLEWLDEGHRLRLREIADRQIRHVEALDEIRDRAAVAQEELMSHLSEQMNERMYVMSIAAALFLPLGFFTGLMGINVGGMPGVDNDLGFWLVAAGCGVVLSGLIALFKRQGWL